MKIECNKNRREKMAEFWDVYNAKRVKTGKIVERGKEPRSLFPFPAPIPHSHSLKKNLNLYLLS